MTLHQAIEKALKEADGLLTFDEITEIINRQKFYVFKDSDGVKTSQVRARIRKYPTIFQTIGDKVTLKSFKFWDQLVKAYSYAADLLSGHYSIADIQFILAVAFYWKRLIDINVIEDNIELVSHPFTSESVFDFDFTKQFTDERDFIIFEEFSALLRKSSSYVLYYFTRIEELDTAIYSDNDYGNIYEYLINLNSLDSQKSPVIYTPESVTSLMVELLSPEEKTTIYDPAAGTGGLLIEAIKKNKNNTGIGVEINQRIALLGYMNIAMHGYSQINFANKNSFNDLSSNSNFDYIISNLPLNGVLNRNSDYDLYREFGITPSSGRGFGALILLIVSKLSPKGKAVVTVSEGFLLKQGREKDVRKYLVRNDLVDTIVSLPVGALRPYTEAKASILILNRNKEPFFRNKIKMIKAQETGGDKHALDLNIGQIVDRINSYNDIDIINTSSLTDSYNLSVSEHVKEDEPIQKLISSGRAFRIHDLCTIQRTPVVDKNDIAEDGRIPFVKIENLSKEIEGYDLKLDSIDQMVVDIEKYQKYIIDTECILVARIGDNLKPTHFKPNNAISKIILHSNVFALILKPGISLDYEYFYFQLYSTIVEEQLLNYRIGSVMPSISMSNLSKVWIPYVDLRSQRDFVQLQKSNIVAQERAKVEEKIKALGYIEEIKNTENEIISTLVHQLRPVLYDIDNEVKRIEGIVKLNDLSDHKEIFNLPQPDEDLSDLVTKPEEKTIKQITDQLREKTLFLNSTLTRVQKVMNYEAKDLDKTTVDLLDFFSTRLSSKRYQYQNTFNIEISGSHFLTPIDTEAFDELIDQLLINARSHGYRENNTPFEKRKVIFNIKMSKTRNIAIIEYGNNGNPYVMDIERYTKLFGKDSKSSGSGIGGNYIYRIIKAHGGNLSIKQNSKSGFSMTMELPLNPLQND